MYKRLLFIPLIAAVLLFHPLAQTPAACAADDASACNAAPSTGFTTASQYANEIYKRWQITANGFNFEETKAMYDIFYAIQNMKFLGLVKNAVIVPGDGDISYQIGCPGDNAAVQLSNQLPYDEAKVIVTHELSHTLQWCQPDSISHFSEISDAISQDHDYLTTYSRNPCLSGVVQNNEDYAETIAYYLNPTIGEQSCAYGNVPNPYSNGMHPAHKALAEKIVGPYSCGGSGDSQIPTDTPEPTSALSPTPLPSQTSPRPTHIPRRDRITPTIPVPTFVCLGPCPSAEPTQTDKIRKHDLKLTQTPGQQNSNRPKRVRPTRTPRNPSRRNNNGNDAINPVPPNVKNAPNLAQQIIQAVRSRIQTMLQNLPKF